MYRPAMENLDNINMSTSISSTEPLVDRKRQGTKWLDIIMFLAIAVIGLYWAKRNPYYHKAFVAAAKHSIGRSIISGVRYQKLLPGMRHGIIV